MADSAVPGAGVRAIVLYKTAKASLQLAATLLLCVLWPLGLPETLGELAVGLRHHITHGWAVSLATVLERGSTNRGVALSILALGLDGSVDGDRGLGTPERALVGTVAGGAGNGLAVAVRALRAREDPAPFARDPDRTERFHRRLSGTPRPARAR